MTCEDIAKLAQFVYELNCKFEEQTDATAAQITHSIQLNTNGDDVVIVFLSQTVYSSVEDNPDVEAAMVIACANIRIILEGIRLLKI